MKVRNAIVRAPLALNGLFATIVIRKNETVATASMIEKAGSVIGGPPAAVTLSFPRRSYGAVAVRN